MSFTKSFTQGGQTQLHNLRMIRQVLGTTLGISLFLGVCVVTYAFFQQHTLSDFLLALMRQWAKLKETLPFIPESTLNILSYSFSDGSSISLTCWDVLYNPRIAPLALKMEHLILQKIMWGFYTILTSFLLISAFWIWMGKRRQKTKILKGSLVQDSAVLKSLVKKMGASPITIAGIPFPQQAEKEHTLICGTTGSGKSNAINSFLNQIRAKGQKAVIVDTTGGYVERYFDATKDYLLNPFDGRTKSWDLWSECEEEYEFLEFADCFVPPSGSDAFWSNAAKQLLSTVAFRLKGTKDQNLGELLKILLVNPFKASFKFLEGSPISSYFDPQSEKTTSNVRSSMVSALQSLAYLTQDKETFSIREWVKNKNDSGWLFIAGMPNQREPLKPLMSAWLSIAVKSLMELDENHDYRLWFVIDELASLNKIPILKQGLAEVRKYGGCFVIGFQNIHQLYAIYRQDDAQTIVSLMGTKLVFKSESAEAAYLSKVFGEQEVLEQSGSVSYGAHQMRDGVSLSDQKKTKPIISPTDIMMLSPLQAYLKFPRQLPFSKVTFPLTRTEKVAEKFIGKSAQEVVSDTTKIHIDLAKLEETSRILPFPLAPERQMKEEDLDPTKESNRDMGFSL